MAGTITYTQSQKRAGGWKPRITSYVLDLTCASGAVSATTVGPIYGRLLAIKFDPVAGAGATMTTTADFILTDAFTGAQVIADLTFGPGTLYRPSVAVSAMADFGHGSPTLERLIAADASGADATHGPSVYRDIFLAGSYKVAIANATTTDTGRVTLVVMEN